MTEDATIRQGPLPDEIRILLHDYPRDSWPGHPNFAQATRNWMGAHQMFRQLSQIARRQTEQYLDKAHSPDDYVVRPSYYGDILVRNLHGHRVWEDHTFFLELSAADPRFGDGLKILEMGHVVLDEVLDLFTSKAALPCKSDDRLLVEHRTMGTRCPPLPRQDAEGVTWASVVAPGEGQGLRMSM